jgi:hypothetical protein
MIQTVAATIATVEARHAAYLNELVGLNPFPYAFDNATEPTVILDTIETFLSNCPGPALELPILPQFRQPQTQSPVDAAPGNQIPTTRPPSRSPTIASEASTYTDSFALALMPLSLAVFFGF